MATIKRKPVATNLGQGTEIRRKPIGWIPNQRPGLGPVLTGATRADGAGPLRKVDYDVLEQAEGAEAYISEPGYRLGRDDPIRTHEEIGFTDAQPSVSPLPSSSCCATCNAYLLLTATTEEPMSTDYFCNQLTARHDGARILHRR